MNKNKKTYLLIALAVTIFLAGLIIYLRGNELLSGLNLVVFVLMIALSGVLLFKLIQRDREREAGLPAEDELSNLIKYKAGYYAFLASMYMWLFIYIFKRYFPDLETLLGGGILLAAIMSTIIKYWVKANYHEE